MKPTAPVTIPATEAVVSGDDLKSPDAALLTIGLCGPVNPRQLCADMTRRRMDAILFIILCILLICIRCECCISMLLGLTLLQYSSRSL
mmetsp:Transcript_9969/g.24892  ORF Transcript_9969/g.24892 Transcript_9969/m.24892 type:complete len:89 (+) Transcript_9969:1426-1692(+)